MKLSAKNCVLLFFAIFAPILHLSSGTKIKWKQIRTQEVKKNEAAGIIRLPRHVIPSHYDLVVVPWLDDDSFMFSGAVDITLTCVDVDLVGTPCSNITVHSKNIDILDVSVRRVSDGSDIPIEPNVDYDPYAEWSTVFLSNPLIVGESANLVITFSGVMSTEIAGLFYRSYDSAGTKKYLAATQFQPSSARTVFPCFDEPNMKASFDISIGRRQDRISYSNMPLSETIPIPEVHPLYMLDKYERTPIMSNYLAIVAVGEYETAQSERDPRHELHFRPGKRAQASFALDLVVNSVNFFEAYYEIPFALPKLGHIAIENFGGAMENYGLITYDENVLLVDPNDPNAAELKAEILLYVAHEIGHQWTGNLVTTNWWDTIWLNEGITEYLTYYSGQTIDPESDWESVLAIMVMNRAIAMDADPQGKNLALVVPVEVPADFDDVFQFTRIYEKGACVTRMLANLLTHTTFRNGMRRYLETHGGGNVIESYLWDAMEAAAVADGTLPGFGSIAGIMHPWTNQPGVPIVTITRDYQTNYAVFSQKRFMSVVNNDHDLDEKWPIFVSFQLGGRGVETQVSTLFLDQGEVQVDLFLGAGTNNSEAWLLANSKREGYYIVNYDTVNWIRLLGQLISDPSVIDPINRAQILSDLTILCAVDIADSQVCAMVPAYLVSESHPIPWIAAAQLLPIWRGSKLMTMDQFDSFLPPMLELALDNLKNQTITPLATDLSNVVLQQLNAMTMSKSPSSGKNKVGNDKIKQSMNILTAWLGHMRRYHQQKNKNVQFVPEILRVLNKREQANRNRKWGRKSQ